MPITQQNVTSSTPMGAQLVATGATFRTWAPRALAVYLNGRFGNTDQWTKKDPNLLLVKDAQGYWAGFLDTVRDGDQYLFYVVGPGGENYKRDPYARELTTPAAFSGTNPYPNCNCVVRRADGYVWRCQNFRPPEFRDLVIYELHVGTFYAVDSVGGDLRSTRPGKYLDIIERLPYLRALGINAVELLPIHEFASPVSRGYEGADLFSPEMDYAEYAPAEVDQHLLRINPLLTAKGAGPLQRHEIVSAGHQLKALIDACHLHGIAVILDVVYNHAGGAVMGQSASLWFFDEMPRGDANSSLYFLDKQHAGGPVFAFWNQDVQGFLANNARFFLEEYRCDGLRYDQVTVIDESGGWAFAQSLSTRARQADQRKPHVAEFWNNQRYLAVVPPPAGLGFDANWHDGLRDAVRDVIEVASRGRDVPLRLDRLANALQNGPSQFPDRWRAVEYLESHDVIDVEHSDRRPRISRLADSNDAHSWWATSRSRVAAGLLLTAPGIPMLFMGQEFLEDKYWTDNDRAHPGNLIYWAGLDSNKRMQDFLRFFQELVSLRNTYRALRSERVNVFHIDEQNRVLASHRWIDGSGEDVVVVCSLNEATFWSYELGFPRRGSWREVFNTDVYENWVNPWVAGNVGHIDAGGRPLHRLPSSATIVLPANTMLVFAKE